MGDIIDIEKLLQEYLSLEERIKGLEENNKEEYKNYSLEADFILYENPSGDCYVQCNSGEFVKYTDVEKIIDMLAKDFHTAIRESVKLKILCGLKAKIIENLKKHITVLKHENKKIEERYFKQNEELQELKEKFSELEYDMELERDL